MIKIFVLILLIFICNSCGSRPTSEKSRIGLPENIKLGQSNLSELETSLGTPNLKVQNSDKTFTVQYDNVGSILVDGSTLKAFFRSPKEDEAHLQYWLQRWKNCDVKTMDIPDSINSNHSEKEVQKICITDKTTIIYNEKNGLVRRVIFYEK